MKNTIIKTTKYFSGIIAFVFVFSFIIKTNAKKPFVLEEIFPSLQQEAQQPDTTELKFPLQKESNIVSTESETESPLHLGEPSNIETKIEYDPVSKEYIIYEKVGDFYYRLPRTMSFEEYSKYQLEKSKRSYWQQKASKGKKAQESFIPAININSEAFDKIFGSNTINITPQGYAELIFSFNMNRIDNPALSEKMRKSPSFTFDEQIMMNVTGSIGDKMNLGISYNTEATFEFENETSLRYEGDEDEIIKNIEAGNVSFSLPGSLITGSQNLFGVKSELQFGKLTVATVFSQQKSESQSMEIRGGAQVSEFSVDAAQYDANRHFFLAHDFYDRYDDALQNLPIINSAIQIQEIEVWVTNKTAKPEGARNIVALADLGEDQNLSFPANGSTYNQVKNDSAVRDITTASAQIQQIFPGYRQGTDFDKIANARKLDPRDYTVNKNLGYVSLNSPLNNDEVLAVAYSYRVNGRSEVFQVGELSKNSKSPPASLIVKMIKGKNLSPKNEKTWNLMMKNIYSINAYQVEKEDFIMDVLYRDDSKGQAVPYIPEERLRDSLLIQAFGLDQLNFRSDPTPDGVFDYISGVTINPSNGRIIFPSVEPFGESLRPFFESKYPGNTPKVDSLMEAYAYTELYDSTQTKAEQSAEKNKFVLSGEYKSASGSEIQLNAMNIPEGSVVVTAGGITLEEGKDYTVDYTLGRVKILNEGYLESGTPIKISLESNSLFNFQTKTLVGTHLNYQFNEDFNLGASFMHLNERPLTSKVNFGDEPISNTIWGFNGAYTTEAPWLTKMVDKIPLIDTKEKSSLTVNGEYAQLFPGSSKAIGENGAGVAYIDDFEGSETTISLKLPHEWVHASIPRQYGSNVRFPESLLNDSLPIGYNRARIAWYRIDPLFVSDNNLTPDHIGKDEISNHFIREIYEEEIWPSRERENNVPVRVAPMNMAYYPTERGPYNFDLDSSLYSAGISEDGRLRDPESRWGGIMRSITTSDFEQSNIEYVEFWVLDPYAMDTNLYNNYNNQYGEDPMLYVNLGDISEDILKDGRKSFEQGLPINEAEQQVLDSTAWGYISTKQTFVHSFDANEESRAQQDKGLDGMNSGEEGERYSDFLAHAGEIIEDEETLAQLNEDPGSDDFHYFRGGDYDAQQVGVLERYKNYNGLEENSRTDAQSNEPYSTTGKNQPDEEDINRDNTMDEIESYYEYGISLHPDDLREAGKNYITDVVEHQGKFANGDPYNVRWLQFRIPVKQFDASIGGIDDFKSIRFIRMYMHGIRREMHMRFAEINLVRGEWRKYQRPLYNIVEEINNDVASTKFEISAVNIEENDDYVLPPGFTRETDPNNPQLRQLNEQSMVLKVENLAEGDARAGYKNLSFDLRQYERLKMEIHASSMEDQVKVNDGDLTVFLRLGSDYTNNYYEYEVPVKVSSRGSLIPTEVWPRENKMNILLDKLIDAKQARNEAMAVHNSGVDLLTLFEVPDEENTIYVRGNPALSNVRTIMIGVRNTNRENYLNQRNDGFEKSAEVWVNELRLTNFKDKSGWAANARMKANLADFGTLSIAAAYSTPGFGSIEQSVNERAQEYMKRLDVAGNFELGKFFPEKAKVSIPMHIGYSESTITPEYDPEDPDVLLEEKLEAADSKSEKNDIKRRAEDKTVNKSINFTNVRVNQTGEKPSFYDPANFSVSYAYNKQEHHDIKIATETQLNYKANFSYIYNNRPNNITPLRSVKALRNPYLRLLRDLNFNLAPSKVSFRTDLNREYLETGIRNLITNDTMFTYFNDYTWNRYFDFKWDISKALTFDFSSKNISRFDEQRKSAEDFGFLGLTNIEQDPDFENYTGMLGARTLNYQHNIHLGWKVPINKIPALDFINMTADYTGNYNWMSGPKNLELENDTIGNTISNNQTVSLRTSLRLTKLYFKVPLLKNIDRKYSGRGRKKQEKETEIITYVREDVYLREGASKSINHKLKTEDITVKVTDKEGNPADPEVRIVNENKIRITVKRDMPDGRVVVEGEVEKRENPVIFLAEQTVRILMGLKDINVNYQLSNGMVIPDFKGNADIFGIDQNIQFSDYTFFAGNVNEDFLDELHEKGALYRNNLVSPVTMNRSEKLDAKATYEPFKGFKIRLTAFKNRSMSEERIYNYDIFPNDPFRNKTEMGNYSISYITLGSAFQKITGEDNYQSDVFDQFNEYRSVVSDMLATELEEKNNSYSRSQDPETIERGYNYGYNSTSREVLLPAFLSAYGYKDINEVTLHNMFPEIPMPNWQVNFDGLSNIEFIEEYFRSINIMHSYRSRYNVSSYATNLSYEEDAYGLPMLDLQNNFMTPYDASSISIDESFSPVVGVEMNWHNSLITSFEWKKSRNLRLNFVNNQLMEDLTNELVFGAGYNIKDFELAINAGNGLKVFTSDLVLRADVTLSDLKTIIRVLTPKSGKDIEYNTINGGDKRHSIKFSADYAMSDSFTVRFFFERQGSEPALSTSHPYANTQIGFSIRFTLVN